MKADNQIIAEFMGAKYMKDDYDSYGYKFEKPFVENWHTMFALDSMKFHASWDWLMPCVEKIESMGYRVKISNTECEIRDRDTYYNVEMSMTKLEATYTAVLEFIKALNEEKEK